MNQGNVQSGAPGGNAGGSTGGELLARAAMDYIKTHYREKFSLQEIAGSLFVNGSYLLRVFRKYTGFTLLAYHNHLRCEQARELLAGTDESVSDISEAIGFVSPAHFSQVFKKEEGCTPTEYRLQHQEGLSGPA